MKRILAALLVVALALIALIFLITRGGEVASIVQHGQGIISLILSILQVVGIALALGLAVFVLAQYTQYIRPNRFVFEGFTNASKLTDAETMPLDLNMLAREKLIHQFKVLDSEWGNLTGDTSSDVDALLTDGLYFGKISKKLEYNKYIPAELAKNSHVLEDLKEVIKSVKDSEGINLMALAEEIAPKEVTPIMKFVEAVVPPHIIRAAGHLQWWADEPGRAGITFEFVDLGSQRNLMVRTIWWQSKLKTNGTTSDAQPPAGIRLDDVAVAGHVASDQEQATVPGDNDILQATDRYIALLNPAMHWLALMFWKQKMASNTPILNYIRKGREKRRQAQLLYLFGALYYACADRFKKYSGFFFILAIEHFRQATIVDPKWCLPYLYLADLYSFKMEKEKEEGTRKKLREEAINLYKKALDCADTYTYHRIMVSKALTELFSDDYDQMGIAKKEIEQSKKELDPADFDPRRADCAAYLYNLAYWYVIAEIKYPVPVPFAKQCARRYVAYCLARSEDLWDIVSKSEVFLEICSKEGLYALKDALDKKREESPLTTLKGDDFKEVINDVLREVAKKVKGWVVDGV